MPIELQPFAVPAEVEPTNLVANLGKTAGTYPIPVALVPGHLGDEDLDALS